MFTSGIYETWMRETQGKKIKGILREIEPKKHILDIGCGPGFLERFIKDSILIDIDLENLKKTSSEGFRVLGDGSNLPFKDKSFKTVFCIDTIHLLNKELTKGEIKRVLSDGIAIISTFCNEYNKTEKLTELKSSFSDFNIEKGFFTGEKEIDAVIVVRNAQKAAVV